MSSDNQQNQCGKINTEGGAYVGGNVNTAGGSFVGRDQNIYTSEQRQTLAEAAAEIQMLLKQLEETNPTSTKIEQVAYINDRVSANFKRRVVGALQAGSEVAIEEFFDNPYIKVGKAIVKGWIKP